MAHVVATYQCEWKEALEDPEKLRRFRTFVNSPVPDPSVVFVPERGQPRPAHTHEKRELLDRLLAQQEEKTAA
jgi:nitrite reductase (NADH) large subunit